ncbi:MAG: aldolase [Lentisphaeria bacterium]|nr:aldolase [Lentisphaeria bacterium]
MTAPAMRPSRVLRKLRAGRPAFCTKTNFRDPAIVDLIGRIGFDCVWLCMEHVPCDWEAVENQIRAAKVHDMDCLVRVAKGCYSDTVRPLEADATGVMVPHLMTAEEARLVVRTTRFHPLGRRPVDGGNADGAYCLLPVEAYMAAANRERFVICQIEDPEPMAELDAIAAVDGIDMLFFGPGDFSHGIGRPGRYDDPDVVAARRAVAAACRRHGRFAGTVAGVESVPQLLEEGFLFLNVGSDVGHLGAGFGATHHALRAYGIEE